MRPVPALLMSALGVALWSGGARTQEAGPSFNCRYAGTATEIAICNSPALAELEMQMYGDYLTLVDRIGEREARRLADQLLERRQACGADRSCIAQRLLVSMEVFRQRAQPEQELAAAEQPEPEPLPKPEQVPEAAPVPEEPAIPLAALEPWPPEIEPAQVGEPEAEVPEVAALEDIAGPADGPSGDDGGLATVELPSETEEVIEPPGDAESELAALEPLPALEDTTDSATEPLAEGGNDPASIEPPAGEEALDPLLAEPLVEDGIASALVEPPVEVDSADLGLPTAEPPVEEDTTEMAALEPPPVEAAPDPAVAEPSTGPSLSGAIEGAELTSSAPQPAPFDTPLSWAFMDLSRADRAKLQGQLQAAGYYQGQGTGIWDQATIDALDAFLASPEGQGFDSDSLSGAALVLDYLGSETFGRTATADPLDAAEW